MHLKHCLPFIGLLALPFSGLAGPKNIVDVAASDGRFDTLVAALQAADLDQAVRSGTFTVLAPTDEAFAKLPKGVVADLLKPENKQQLQGVLTYHVIANKKQSLADLLSAGSFATLQGDELTARFADGRVYINDSMLLQADVKAANGVVHVIDSVLIPAPKGPPNLVETAQAAGTFNTLLAAAQQAGLAEALAGQGPFTVFAPTDAAFKKLPHGTVAELLKPENKARLAAILKYHVVPAKVGAGDALKAGSAQTLHGAAVDIAYRDGALRVEDAKVLTVDIEASNGIIHVIDSVLMPPENTAQRAMQLIEYAIDKGVPAYNHGSPETCSMIYMKVSKALMHEEALPDHATQALRKAVHSASATHCHDTRSWTLRHGLDTAYHSLQEVVVH